MEIFKKNEIKILKENLKMNSLTVNSVLALLTREQQLELYITLYDKLPKAENSLESRLKKIEDKYFDLVWMARKDEELLEARPEIRKIFNEVSAKYPGELEKLQSEEGDWRHGFNSGMLACCRLLFPYALPYNFKEVIGCESDEEGEEKEVSIDRNFLIDHAEEEFPDLDT